MMDNKPTNNKRKRGSLDNDGPGTRGAPSSGYRRVSPTNNHADSNALEGAAHFLSAHDTTGQGADDMHHSTDPSIDFARQLEQHNNPGAHSILQNGAHTVSNATDTAAAALSQFHSMTIPQPTELSFQTNTTGVEGDRAGDSSFTMGDSSTYPQVPGTHDFDLNALKSGSQTNEQGNDSSSGGHAGSKPAVGTDEWHKVRRDNHKEVERRRRETINEGINELAKIVPGCEKNKGSILQRAVQFITQLKENEAQNIEKWTLEKLLTEQAIAELSASCDKLKAELERLAEEKDGWMKMARRRARDAADDDGQAQGQSQAETDVPDDGSSAAE
ncbi:basic helix-loop-helix protein [Cryomyces antarcticus]|uniref:Basic helix-loop-helix protein n=1 Tax=Cryomyces antarcticus TaxID=329879 RepID=A0ABR0LY37_9PEZI|nr:basic helix-loop-helix protein [Cryomyces antarcticus]